MTMRTKRTTITFVHSFLLREAGRTLPAGEYEVLTDEELIEGLSFPVYRRISTMILVPGQGPPTSFVEMLTVDPRELQVSLARDAAMQQPPQSDAASIVPEVKPAGDQL